MLIGQSPFTEQQNMQPFCLKDGAGIHSHPVVFSTISLFEELIEG